MVILIGGSSHVGKSLIAHKLVRKLGYDCICLDHLKEAFLHSQMGSPGNLNDYEMRYWMWPFVREIIRHAISSGRNLIVEGCYIPCEWARGFSEKELEQIRTVFIVMGEDYLRSHFKDVEGYSGVVERREGDVLDLERLIRCSDKFREGCIQTGTYYIDIRCDYDEESFLDAVLAVIETHDNIDGGIVL